MQLIGKKKCWKSKERKEKFDFSILSDGWTNDKNCTIIKFLVSRKNNKISGFGSNKFKTAESLALMLEQVFVVARIENLVQKNPHLVFRTLEA